MREENIRFRRYVVDDGWNAPSGEPQEIFEDTYAQCLGIAK